MTIGGAGTSCPPLVLVLPEVDEEVDEDVEELLLVDELPLEPLDPLEPELPLEPLDPELPDEPVLPP